MNHQDWEVVTIGGSKAKDKVKAAHVKTTPEAQAARKIADADAPLKLKTLASESRQEIIQRRVANKWSQADLNMRCCFPVNTIREIEAGRVTPNIQQLNTLNRILKCGLKLSN